MLPIVLNNLKNIESPIADLLLKIYEGKLEVVAEDYYATTIFENQNGFDTQMQYFNNYIQSVFRKTIVESPLIFVKSGKTSSIPCAEKGQGVSFGWTMIDYISKKPLIIVNVIYADKFKYNSIVWDAKTSSYVIGVNATKVCADAKALLDFVVLNAGKDIEKFVTK